MPKRENPCLEGCFDDCKTNLVEGRTLLSALFLGMVLALEYDCIRIFRRVIRHKNIWVMSAEDILYWIYAAVTVFCMTYEVNDGILRGFLVTGFLAGAVLYRYAFGTFFVKYTTKFINLCLKPLKKALCLIKIGVHKITGCIKAAAVRKRGQGNEV